MYHHFLPKLHTIASLCPHGSYYGTMDSQLTEVVNHVCTQSKNHEFCSVNLLSRNSPIIPFHPRNPIYRSNLAASFIYRLALKLRDCLSPIGGLLFTASNWQGAVEDCLGIDVVFHLICVDLFV